MVKYTETFCRSFLLALFIVQQCVGPPTKQKVPGHTSHDNSSDPDPQAKSLDDIGLEYSRYLKEVVEALESDAEFRKKLESAGEVDFRSGKVAAELEYVNHHVRTKLDELKRTELQRLRQLVKESEMLEKKQKNVETNHIAGHLDHTNEHTFEVADLHKLITKVRLDLEEADRKRREEFKEYEMQKHFEQEQKMKSMDEEHRKKYQEELEAQKKKHNEHEQLHHPGSKAQLEEVWEKEDHMENQKFNPRTFFHLHDLDGNGYWDEEEVKALFLKEMQKVYDPNAPEDDMRDRDEEMERMREHVFSEADTNKDRLISYAEFLEQTKKQEFERDDGWESLDQKPQYSQQEYEEFEKRRQIEIQRLIDQGLLQPYAPGMMPPPHAQYGVHPAQVQQHPGQTGGYVQPPNPQYQYGGQVQYHQPQPQQQYGQPIHPGQVPPQYNHQQQPGVPSSSDLHPNQIQQHPNQPPPIQYHQNQVPMHQQQQTQQQQQQQQVHPNQIPHLQTQQQQQQQQYKPAVPNSNEIPHNNQPPPVPQQQQINQQAPQQINQQAPIVNIQDHNIPPAGGNNPQPPQYQQQVNDIQQKQYQTKYESHGNKIASNEKINHDNMPK